MNFQDRTYSEIFRHVASATLTILIICFGYPLGVIIFVPVLINGYIIEKLAKTLDPKCGKLLKDLDAAMSADSPYSNPRSVAVPQYYLASTLDINKLIATFNQKIIQAKNPNGKLLYVQLKQRIVAIFGYHFGYDVDNFDLRSYIKLLDESCPDRVVRQSGMIDLIRQLSKRPFDPSRSPWEIFLIPKFQSGNKKHETKSVVIMRFHHLLVDGFCVRKCLRD